MCEIRLRILSSCLESEDLQSSSSSTSHEPMVMKCTNLIAEDNKNSDDDNQDSKSKTKQQQQRKRKSLQHTCLTNILFSILANEIINKIEQNGHQQR